MTSTNTFRKGGPPSILNSVTSRFGGVGADDVPAQRPMTSVKAAGYSSTGQGSRPVFDPLMQGARGPAPALQKKPENTPEDVARLMEHKVRMRAYARERVHVHAPL
jgi:intraflagellar transport protein 88